MITANEFKNKLVKKLLDEESLKFIEAIDEVLSNIDKVEGIIIKNSNNIEMEFILDYVIPVYLHDTISEQYMKNGWTYMGISNVKTLEGKKPTTITAINMQIKE